MTASTNLNVYKFRITVKKRCNETLTPQEIASDLVDYLKQKAWWHCLSMEPTCAKTLCVLDLGMVIRNNDEPFSYPALNDFLYTMMENHFILETVFELKCLGKLQTIDDQLETLVCHHANEKRVHENNVVSTLNANEQLRVTPLIRNIDEFVDTERLIEHLVTTAEWPPFLSRAHFLHLYPQLLERGLNQPTFEKLLAPWCDKKIGFRSPFANMLLLQTFQHNQNNAHESILNFLIGDWANLPRDHALWMKLLNFSAHNIDALSSQRICDVVNMVNEYQAMVTCFLFHALCGCKTLEQQLNLMKFDDDNWRLHRIYFIFFLPALFEANLAVEIWQSMYNSLGVIFRPALFVFVFQHLPTNPALFPVCLSFAKKECEEAKKTVRCIFDKDADFFIECIRFYCTQDQAREILQAI
jgi:hypothetical protein